MMKFANTIDICNANLDFLGAKKWGIKTSVPGDTQRCARNYSNLVCVKKEDARENPKNVRIFTLSYVLIMSRAHVMALTVVKDSI